MAYVDGFVFARTQEEFAGVPAHCGRRPGKSGASTARSTYIEAVADDVKPGKSTSFPRSFKPQARGNRVLLIHRLQVPPKTATASTPRS